MKNFKTFKVTVDRYGFFCYFPQPHIESISVRNGCNVYNNLLEIFDEHEVYFDKIRLKLKVVENRFNKINEFYTDCFHGIDLQFIAHKDQIEVIYKTNVGSSELDGKVFIPIRMNESVTLDIDKDVPYVLKITIDYVNYRGD